MRRKSCLGFVDTLLIYLLSINRCIFEGDLFNSYLAAIKFMESRDEFGEDDISKIGLLLEENAKMSRVEDTRVASEVIAKLESLHKSSYRQT